MEEGVHMGDLDLGSAVAAATDTSAVAAGEPSGMETIVSTIGNINLGQVLMAFLFFFVFAGPLALKKD